MTGERSGVPETAFIFRMGRNSEEGATWIAWMNFHHYLGLAEFRLWAFPMRKRRISWPASPSSGDHSFTPRSCLSVSVQGVGAAPVQGRP
jgi:hypothetical protein